MDFDLIKARRGRAIYFNKSNGIYRKIFPGTLPQRLTYMFGLSVPPGNNFQHIARCLECLDIHTPEIVSFSPLIVDTVDVGGEYLRDKLLKSNSEEITFWLDQYTTVVGKTLRAGIFFADIHFKNYLVKGKKLYALDLDNYRDGPFAAWRAHRLLHRMDRKILPLIVGKLWRRAERSGDQDCVQRIKKAVTVERISDLIRKKAAAFHAPAMTTENSA